MDASILSAENARLRDEIARLTKEQSKIRKGLTECIDRLRSERDLLKFQLNQQNQAA